MSFFLNVSISIYSDLKIQFTSNHITKMFVDVPSALLLQKDLEDVTVVAIRVPITTFERHEW